MKLTILATALALTLTTPAWAREQGVEYGVLAYEHGDYATALRVLRPLAEEGDASAQFHLGFLYRQGWGVPEDYTEAVRWFRKSANQGFAWGQYFLGSMYIEGHGVPQDDVQAQMWLSLAAAQGDKNARLSIELIAQRMTPDQIAKAQRMAREWREPHRPQVPIQ